MTSLMLSVLVLMGVQAAPGWDRVTALTGGGEIRVELAAGSVTGQFVTAAPDAITLRVSGRETTINRTSVNAVHLRSGKSHRLRNAGIGFLAGLGLGVVAYKATCNSNCLAEGAVAWTVPLELAGAITGAVWPSGGWETIYRR